MEKNDKEGRFMPYGAPYIDEEDRKAVSDVLKSTWLTTGPKVTEFESAVCKFTGAKYAVAVNSGTSALDIAIGALDLEPGSEIITTPFTFVATSNAIIYNGHKPVFVDVDPETYNIDPEKIKERINDKTKAIIFVDFAGHPCNMDEIRKIASDYKLKIVDDAAHAIGAEYNGKKIGCGAFADITTFSFHPVKTMTTGEGGMCLTNDETLFKKMSMLRNHGIDKSAMERFGSNAGWAFDMKILGRNYRMTDFQAALGTSQLKKLPFFIKKREQLAARYDKAFSQNTKIKIPTIKPNVRSGWHLYTILIDDSIKRDDIFNYMRSKNIGVAVHCIPVYHHTYYKEYFNFSEKDFPVAERIFKRILALPLHPNMADGDVERVIKELNAAIEKFS